MWNKTKTYTIAAAAENSCGHSDRLALYPQQRASPSPKPDPKPWKISLATVWLLKVERIQFQLEQENSNTLKVVPLAKRQRNTSQYRECLWGKYCKKRHIIAVGQKPLISIFKLWVFGKLMPNYLIILQHILIFVSLESWKVTVLNIQCMRFPTDRDNIVQRQKFMWH